MDSEIVQTAVNAREALTILLDQLEASGEDVSQYSFVMCPEDWAFVEDDCVAHPVMPEYALGSFQGHWVFVLETCDPDDMFLIPFEAIEDVLEIERAFWKDAN
jgi:hypothetical protein